MWCRQVRAGGRALERIYLLLLNAGYPKEGIDWLRRRRMAVIIGLAIGAWIIFIGLGWLIWTGITSPSPFVR
jgi:hypothetical protein